MLQHSLSELVQACPLCGSKDHSLFDQRTFREIPVTNLICQNCGLVFQSPRMNDAERQAFYEQGYRELYQGQEAPLPADLNVQSARAAHTIAFLGDRLKSGCQILDIGCSAGILLKQFQDKFQAKVTGVEPGKMYREFAISTGLKVFSSLDELQKAMPERFDLISMIHVLEHLPDPQGSLQNLRKTLLAPDGWLLLEVPNLYAHDCFEVAHLASFSAHTLTQTLQQAGYQLVKLRLHGMPRSRLIPLYLVVLAQPYRGTTQPPAIRKEVGIQPRRKLGLFRRKLVERLLPRYAWQSP